VGGVPGIRIADEEDWCVSATGAQLCRAGARCTEEGRACSYEVRVVNECSASSPRWRQRRQNGRWMAWRGRTQVWYRKLPGRVQEGKMGWAWPCASGHKVFPIRGGVLQIGPLGHWAPQTAVDENSKRNHEIAVCILHDNLSISCIPIGYQGLCSPRCSQHSTKRDYSKSPGGRASTATA
jgi:hypothetical protein